MRLSLVDFIADGKLTLYRADSTWADRKSQLPQFSPEVIAIDGPLLPPETDIGHARFVERFFSRSLFCRRCKPGLSHFGTGYLLRLAAHNAREQFGQAVGGRVVEAFPNLFLGVMVSDDQYNQMPKLRRGQKFDWLYDCAQAKLAQLRDWVPLTDDVYKRLADEQDHEHRAALICLLTAGLEATGQAAKAGEHQGGWFWLPPQELWERWAIETVWDQLNGGQDGNCTHKAHAL